HTEKGSEQVFSNKYLWFELRYIEPFLLPPAFESELGELHAFRALEKPPREAAFAGDVLKKELPLHLEGVVVAFVGHFLPPLEKIDRLRDIRIPHRLGRLGIRLGEAAPQAGD